VQIKKSLRGPESHIVWQEGDFLEAAGDCSMKQPGSDLVLKKERF
jgi:hypothetical protein